MSGAAVRVLSGVSFVGDSPAFPGSCVVCVPLLANPLIVEFRMPHFLLPFVLGSTQDQARLGTDIYRVLNTFYETAAPRRKRLNQDAKEGVMRSTRARLLLENLESRALLTTYAGFCFPWATGRKRYSRHG